MFLLSRYKPPAVNKLIQVIKTWAPSVDTQLTRAFRIGQSLYPDLMTALLTTLGGGGGYHHMHLGLTSSGSTSPEFHHLESRHQLQMTDRRMS